MLFHLLFSLGCLAADTRQFLCVIPTQSATLSQVSVSNNSSSGSLPPFNVFRLIILQNSALNITLGFAMPLKEEKQYNNEALVLGSFPLPYGFAGVVMGELETPVEQGGSTGLFWYIVAAPAVEAGDIPFTIDGCRAEMATPGQNNTLIPLLTTPVTATFSPLTTWGTNAAQFIFRCQNCSIMTDTFDKHAEAKLMAMVSTAYPEYIDDTKTMANLSLIGSKQQGFTLNTTAARFSNYSSFLSVAGFV
ncbi:hypothetical protein C8R43DRAFT_962965 [Mycena crocata]|nr:hypothetical protein C8R43DRAFT_962965 [Mycena crocata]